MKTGANLTALAAGACDEILLAEDNSKRALSRPAIGVTLSNSDARVIIRLRRISAAGCEVLAERTYLFRVVDEMRYDGWLGSEYRPAAADGSAWFRAAGQSVQG